MGKCDELIVKYVDDLKNKCGMELDMDLLIKVIIGCGLVIYNVDVLIVVGGQEFELEIVKNNFLIKKLGLLDGLELMDVINLVIEVYGKFECNKYCVVVYYMLIKKFGKELIYG